MFSTSDEGLETNFRDLCLVWVSTLASVFDLGIAVMWSRFRVF